MRNETGHDETILIIDVKELYNNNDCMEKRTWLTIKNKKKKGSKTGAVYMKSFFVNLHVYLYTQFQKSLAR